MYSGTLFRSLSENVLTDNIAQRRFSKLKLKRREVSKWQGKPVAAENLVARLV